MDDSEIDVQALIEEIKHKCDQTHKDFVDVAKIFTEDPYRHDPNEKLLDNLDSTFFGHAEEYGIYDRCFRYELTPEKRDEGFRTILEISMLGPYAVVYRQYSLDTSFLIYTMPPTIAEKILVRHLEKAGLTLLSNEILITPISVKLFHTPPEKIRIYHALFCDRGPIPWAQISYIE